MTDDLTATRGDTREAPDERHGMSENEAAAEVDVDHNDGCLTEHTWDEDDCNCRACTVCGQALHLGRCRWTGAR